MNSLCIGCTIRMMCRLGNGFANWNSHSVSIWVRLLKNCSHWDFMMWEIRNQVSHIRYMCLSNQQFKWPIQIDTMTFSVILWTYGNGNGRTFLVTIRGELDIVVVILVVFFVQSFCIPFPTWPSCCHHESHKRFPCSVQCQYYHHYPWYSYCCCTVTISKSK